MPGGAYQIFIPFIPSGKFMTFPKTLNKESIFNPISFKEKNESQAHFSWIQFLFQNTTTLPSTHHLLCNAPRHALLAPKAVFCILVDSLSLLLLVWGVQGYGVSF